MAFKQRLERSDEMNHRDTCADSIAESSHKVRDSWHVPGALRMQCGWSRAGGGRVPSNEIRGIGRPSLIGPSQGISFYSEKDEEQLQSSKQRGRTIFLKLHNNCSNRCTTIIFRMARREMGKSLQ